MNPQSPDFRVICVPLDGAALLTAAGFPRAAIDDDRLVSTSDLKAWSLAVVGPGAVRDGLSGIHFAQCRKIAGCSPIATTDLVGIRGECSCGASLADVAITDPELSADAVEELLYGFRNQLRDYPPAAEAGLLAEVRAVRFGQGIGALVQQFLDANMMMPAPTSALGNVAALMNADADSGALSLRTTGLSRLRARLEALEPTAQMKLHTVSRRDALATAEMTIPGAGQADDSPIVCFYRRLDTHIDAALIASGTAAVAFASHQLRQVAVAVLPRRVAVLLHAEPVANTAFGQALVFAAPAGASPAMLPACCDTALRLWTSGADPKSAWLAARAALH